MGNAPIQNKLNSESNNKRYKYLLPLNSILGSNIKYIGIINGKIFPKSVPGTATATAQLWTGPVFISGLSIGPDTRFEISNQFDFVGRKLARRLQQLKQRLSRNKFRVLSRRGIVRCMGASRRLPRLTAPMTSARDRSPEAVAGGGGIWDMPPHTPKWAYGGHVMSGPSPPKKNTSWALLKQGGLFGPARPKKPTFSN